MRIWFWGWLIAAGAIALVAVVLRDRASFPFSIGAAVAAALESAGADPGIEWAAFAGVSFVVFAVVNRRRYTPRHMRRGLGRHGTSEPRGK